MYVYTSPFWQFCRTVSHRIGLLNIVRHPSRLFWFVWWSEVFIDALALRVKISICFMYIYIVTLIHLSAVHADNKEANYAEGTLNGWSAPTKSVALVAHIRGKTRCV